MDNFCLTVPTLFGLEGLAAAELRRLGLEGVAAEDGRVRCQGSLADIPRLNINLRTGERVQIELGRFPARDFDALFEGTKALPWEDFIPANGAFPVKGYSLSSQLSSEPACQSIIKKAVAERLGQAYGYQRLPEDGPLYQIQFALLRDQVSLLLDTTGPALHKRGYREEKVVAPLRETLAAALVLLSRYRGRDSFRDPHCGSGTIAIEAALIARNIAPGLRRSYICRSWDSITKASWKRAVEEARDKEFQGEYDIWGGDIDPQAVATAKKNAARAGVGELIRFQTGDSARFRAYTPAGRVVTNPPYGQRLLDQADTARLYQDFAKACQELALDWQVGLLTPVEDFETIWGRPADKRRKLYNGKLKCYFYMFGGNVR